MSKKAVTTYPVHEYIQNRWSPRAFADKLIDKNKIMSLFEAARWSASAFNEQPWRFIYATRDNPEAFNKLLNCLVEGNRIWCKNAPLLILTVVKKTFSNNKQNTKAEHDLGLATGNLTFQAMSMGLYVHPMSGIDVDNAIKIFNIPVDYLPSTMIAAGYLGNPEQLPEHLMKPEISPRKRKPFNEIVFEGKFEIS